MKLPIAILFVSLPFLGCIKYKSAYSLASKSCSTEDEEAGNCTAANAEASAPSEDEGSGESDDTGSEMDDGSDDSGSGEEDTGTGEEDTGTGEEEDSGETNLALTGKGSPDNPGNPANKTKSGKPKAKWEAVVNIAGKDLRLPVKRAKSGKLRIASKGISATDPISKIEVFKGTRLQFVTKPGTPIKVGKKGGIQANYCRAKGGSGSDLVCK